jgi:hypothetical protein
MRSLEDIMNKLFECNMKSINNYREHEYIEIYLKVLLLSIEYNVPTLKKYPQIRLNHH